ncbi:MAG: complex I subunit 1/NuoH family protein [Phycisphaeraceae bacterium]
MTAQFLISLFVITVVLHLMLLACAYLILLERKVSAWAQDRIGPNRTNFSFGVLPFKGKHFGLGQALADGLKLFVKEDYNPPHVERALFLLAPVMAIVPAMIAWAVIPWGGMMLFPEMTIPGWIPIWGGAEIESALVTVAVAPINIGVLFILAWSSLAVYGVVVAGYASNNKYSFLGGIRATAQMLSYEIPLGLCVLIMIMTYQGFDTTLMSTAQVGEAGSGGFGAWGVLIHPFLAVIFFITLLAETNRAPFDLAEAEQELVGGFHTEYSSMKWALFFLGEYMHMITGAAFFAVLFLGGWSLNPFGFVLPFDLPTVSGIGGVLAKMGVFFLKVAILLFIIMWVRWTLPRPRFDQLMKMAWRGLIPVTLVMLLVTTMLVFIDKMWGLPMLGLSFLIANVLVALGAALIGPRLPAGPPVNRRIPLEGSRFNPPRPEPAGQA